MRVGRWLAGALVCSFLAACAATNSEPVNPDLPADPTLLVSGEVVRVDTAHSYVGEAAFREGAHAVVTLCYMPGMDAVCEPLVTQRLENVGAFPIPFLLEGDSETVFSRIGYYLVSATVYMGPSDDLYIGDFVAERWHEISGPVPDMEIVTSGLEMCGTPTSGGACATEVRP